MGIRDWSARFFNRGVTAHAGGDNIDLSALFIGVFAAVPARIAAVDTAANTDNNPPLNIAVQYPFLVDGSFTANLPNAAVTDKVRKYGKWRVLTANRQEVTEEVGGVRYEVFLLVQETVVATTFIGRFVYQTGPTTFVASNVTAQSLYLMPHIRYREGAENLIETGAQAIENGDGEVLVTTPGGTDLTPATIADGAAAAFTHGTGAGTNKLIYKGASVETLTVRAVAATTDPLTIVHDGTDGVLTIALFAGDTISDGTTVTTFLTPGESITLNPDGGTEYDAET